MGQDVLPSSDHDLVIFLVAYLFALSKDPAKYAHTPQDVADFQARLTQFQTDLQAHDDAQQAALAATEVKDKSRAPLEDVARLSMHKVNGSAGIDNARRALLGMHTHAVTRVTVAAPTTRPHLRIEDRGASRQAVHYFDEMTPTTPKKPSGTAGVELYYKIDGTPPVDNTGCALARIASESPFVQTFQPADVGKTVHWIGRWTSTGHEPGPYGPVISTRINS